MKRILLFDAGGTLVFPDFMYLQLLLCRQGLDTFTVEQLRHGYYEVIHDFDCAMRRDGLTHGSPWTEDGYARAVLTRLGLAEKWIAPVSEMWNARHGEQNLWTYTTCSIQNALLTLCGMGYRYRMAVFSNSDGRTAWVFNHIGFTGYFECIFDSAVIGKSKPDVEAFLCAVQELGAAPSEALYIGDIYVTDVVGAQNAGLRAIHIDPYRLYSGWPGVHLRGVSDLPRWLEEAQL